MEGRWVSLTGHGGADQRRRLDEASQIPLGQPLDLNNCRHAGLCGRYLLSGQQISPTFEIQPRGRPGALIIRIA
jgi:hypothetical protein